LIKSSTTTFNSETVCFYSASA